MTIQIELNPEMMERLAAEAEAQGIALEDMRNACCGRRLLTTRSPQGQLSVAELHAMLNGIAEGSEKLPKVPTAAFTRESFYEDRR